MLFWFQQQKRISTATATAIPRTRKRTRALLFAVQFKLMCGCRCARLFGRHNPTLTAGTETDPPCSFDMKAGTVLVFDYRLVHRGTANKTGVGAIVARTNTDDDEEREDPIPKKKVKLDADGDDGDSDGGGVERALGDTNAKQDAVGRPLLYFVYSKTWWTDTRNFNTHEHLFNGKE